MPPPSPSVKNGKRNQVFARTESYNTQYFHSKRTNLPTLEENAYVTNGPPAHEYERFHRFETRKDFR